MISMKAPRLFRASLLLVLAVALSACGFHLRQNANLPPQMQRVHLAVSGGGELERRLTRALQTSDVTVEDNGGPGIAELRVPVAVFRTETLSAGGYVQISEFAVRYHVEFEVDDAAGHALLPHQRIDMSREYSYDASNTVGNESQVQELQRSLNDDMVQAILFRLQAASKHQLAEPASAASTH
ncbi:LPS-assembly lipoprotein [Rhodanobacter sp. TND4EL1]